MHVAEKSLFQSCFEQACYGRLRYLTIYMSAAFVHQDHQHQVELAWPYYSLQLPSYNLQKEINCKCPDKSKEKELPLERE